MSNNVALVIVIVNSASIERVIKPVALETTTNVWLGMHVSTYLLGHSTTRSTTGWHHHIFDFDEILYTELSGWRHIFFFVLRIPLSPKKVLIFFTEFWSLIIFLSWEKNWRGVLSKNIFNFFLNFTILPMQHCKAFAVRLVSLPGSICSLPLESVVLVAGLWNSTIFLEIWEN